MTTAHPNITITDELLTRDDIEKFYSKWHADVWDLIRTAGLASKMRPAIFEVVSLSARCGEHPAQARGKRQVEPGWAELYPEEEIILARELPEDPNLLEALASGPLAIEGADVIETRTEGARPLDVAELIRVMKDEEIGRPSTYASHVEAMFECVDLGWLFLDDAGRFRVTEAGRVLLDVLADPTLPRLDKSYTAELETDLNAIERGEKSPDQVLRRHLGRLPGIEVDIQADALDSIRESTEPDKSKGEHFQPSPPINAAPLPAEIDPETVLAPSHPLRVLRAEFDTVIRDAFGNAHPNQCQASKHGWLERGGYTINVAGKLYLCVVNCPCPACQEDAKVAALLATSAFQIDDEDSESCFTIGQDDTTEDAGEEPAYLSHVGAISDQQLRARIDAICPTFWPNRYGVYRNHCQACGYEFHENRDLFGRECPFTPTSDPMCSDPQSGAIDLDIEVPAQIAAGLRWIGTYHVAACPAAPEDGAQLTPIALKLASAETEPEQNTEVEQGQDRRDSSTATHRKGFWSNLLALFGFGWRCLVKAVKAVFWPPVAIYRRWRRSGWNAWNNALRLQTMKGAELIRVRRIRQVARTGTKAYAEWLGSGEQRPVWVPGTRVGVGQYLLVQGDMGYGKHHDEYVFFINRLLCVLPASAYSRWREHEAFIKKRALAKES